MKCKIRITMEDTEDGVSSVSFEGGSLAEVIATAISALHIVTPSPDRVLVDLYDWMCEEEAAGILEEVIIERRKRFLEEVRKKDPPGKGFLYQDLREFIDLCRPIEKRHGFVNPDHP